MAVLVRLVGTFAVHTGSGADTGAPETERVIGSPKARRLLALLAAHGGRTVTPDRLADALWAGGPRRTPPATWPP